MPPKIPRGFGISKPRDDFVSTSKARPSAKGSSDKEGVSFQEVPKDGSKGVGKRLMETPPETYTKKLKSGGAPSAHVANLFGPVSVAYVGENAVHKWQSLPPVEQDAAMIEASAQLLVQSIGRAQRNQEERLVLEKLRGENKKLTGMVVESDNKWKKALDAKEADLVVVRDQLEESVKTRGTLVAALDELKREKEEMQLRIDTLEIEKGEINDAGFQRGFDCFMTGFLSHEPSYDWAKWGQGPAEDVTQFKIDHAGAIKQRRIDLGFEKESPVGAPSVEDASVINESVIPEVQETQSSAAPLDEQTDVVNVPPPSTQDAS